MGSYRYANKTIFILGVPRSGTSWIGKMFDAHPDVLYRHEPDILVRNTELPFICDDDQVCAYRGEAAEWLNTLAAISAPQIRRLAADFSEKFSHHWTDGVASCLHLWAEIASGAALLQTIG